MPTLLPSAYESQDISDLSDVWVSRLYSFFIPTNSREQSPFDKLIFVNLVENIPCPLWKPNVRYRVHKSPPLGAILRNLNLVHFLIPNLNKIHFNIVFPSLPMSPKWPLTFKCYNWNFVCFSLLSHACYMLSHSHRLWFGHRNNSRWKVKVTKLLIL